MIDSYTQTHTHMSTTQTHIHSYAHQHKHIFTCVLAHVFTQQIHVRSQIQEEIASKRKDFQNTNTDNKQALNLSEIGRVRPFLQLQNYERKHILHMFNCEIGCRMRNAHKKAHIPEIRLLYDLCFTHIMDKILKQL